MAKSSMNILLLAALMIMCSVFQSSEAQKSHIVGDYNGWRIPSGDAAMYTTWASQQKFAVGDTLVFNFVTGTHDVTKVTKASYDSCTGASPISSATTGPTTIILSTVGDHYFICSFAGHCSAGQKLTVTVAQASTATPPTTTATPPSTAASPPNTTATSPSIAAMPPTTTAMPPTTTASPPMTTATSPSGSAASPKTSTFPSSQSPSASMVPAQSNSAMSLVAAALPMTLVSLTLFFLH